MSIAEPLTQSPQPPRAWPWWTLLILLCSLIFGIHFLEKSTPATPPDPAKTDSPILKLYARYLMGADDLLQWSAPSQTASPTPEAALEPLDDAAPTIMEQLRVVPIAAELIDQGAALTRLDKIDAELAKDPSIDDGFRRDAAALRALYTDQPLDQTQRDELTARHDWFARLALSYGKPDTDPDRQLFANEAKRAMVAIFALFFLIVIAGIAGFALFITAAVLTGSGKITSAFAAAVPASSPPLSASNAFLETFVLFLTSFLAASAVAEVAHSLTGIDISFILFWIIPLLALWPLSRGLNWPQLRADIGWHSGQGILKEIGCGIVGYLAGIPIMVLGVVLSVLIITLSGTDSSHPIVNEIGAGGPLALFALFLMTTIWAPLVEESFFRGALYAHLRGLPLPFSPAASVGEDPGEGSASPAFSISSTPMPSPHHPRRGLSIIPAALITGFIFAIIHPQGFGGVPVLTALGFNFCLLREWRGSLIAPMTAHALHNGVATIALVMFLA